MINKPNSQSSPDLELLLIEETINQLEVGHSGYIRNLVINFLIALKSKPFIILTGPPESAKEKLVEDFNNILIGKDTHQYQTMIGHPWWAAKSINVIENIRFQSRFNTFKLELLLEEAVLFHNKNRIFIATMTKISRGELLEYFTETAFQLRHGQIMRLPGSHFFEPIPFPTNLSIIGTLDSSDFSWVDSDLLPQTTILPCLFISNSSSRNLKATMNQTSFQKVLLQSSIRSPQQAFKKILKVTNTLSQALLPFLQITQILRKELSRYAGNFLTEGMIYLANSWSQTGNGLFSKDPRENLQFALDLAIIQSLFLPCTDKISQSKNLQDNLHKILGNKFPNAAAYLHQLNPL
ncbi:MAG: hypothetical protein BGO78_14995 [Chloroflexi bacterium 44-23]|nr:MAG: hypothetical protein BGO78_14995 [Chloroflexi bacterium 44-23]